jgi:DNA polymerase elongation subunit (family B)
MTLWLIPASGSGSRLKLVDRSFRPSFYAYGPEPRLKHLAQSLAARAPVVCALTRRTDIWEARELVVLEITAQHPTQFLALVRAASRFDQGMRLYNSDLMLAPLYCWEKNVFPLAKVEIDVGTGLRPAPTIHSIESRDDEWAIDYELPPFKTLRIRMEGLGEVDPKHGRRGKLEVEVDGQWLELDDQFEPVAVGFERLLRTHDPDLILSEWGDSTLFPGILQQARRERVNLSLNRDPAHPVAGRSRARSYTSYGRILFKAGATTLFGRLHVDTSNSFIADQCDMDGLWELARVTKLPVQYSARTTTGTGISHMQMELAWRDGVLIPGQKAEPESPKHPDELLMADRGGMVFPPRLGFHENVAELDFISEFPSIMARFNVSPETVNCRCCPDTPRVPELGYRVCQRRRGITSRVVERLIWKREEFKKRVASRPSYKQRRSSLKWLLVCCFGYTGYKNARFGKIEAHEAINAFAREKLLVAMETAERAGYRVLHALVDSLYIQRLGATREDYARMVREIERETGLPMALESVYRYVVFLPSKQHAEVPAPNRFFCVPEDGSEIKIRGLECRRHDTAPIVARMQREALSVVAEAHDYESYCRKMEDAREVLRRYLERVENGSAPIEELVVRRRMTRPPEAYKQSSATAVASRQLDRSGVQLRPGEMIEYIITKADSNCVDDRYRAFTMWEGWHGYDVAEYQRALREAFKPLEQFARPAELGAQRSLFRSVASAAEGRDAPQGLKPSLFRISIGTTKVVS